MVRTQGPLPEPVVVDLHSCLLLKQMVDILRGGIVAVSAQGHLRPVQSQAEGQQVVDAALHAIYHQVAAALSPVTEVQQINPGLLHGQCYALTPQAYRLLIQSLWQAQALVEEAMYASKTG